MRETQCYRKLSYHPPPPQQPADKNNNDDDAPAPITGTDTPGPRRLVVLFDGPFGFELMTMPKVLMPVPFEVFISWIGLPVGFLSRLVLL